MPIISSVPITVFDQEAFHSVDKVVTGLSFQIHNEFGRYLDERLYQAELAGCLATHGFTVVREMTMALCVDSFTKRYAADFLINGGVIVENKAVEALTRAHTGQVLNYLYMCGLHHGTLLNLRPEKVEHRFVSTSLTLEDRRRISWETTNWKRLSDRCELLKATVTRALEDWGARLDPGAYRDAAVHFLGGEAAVMQEVTVRSQHGPLGRQKVCLLSDEIAFTVTAALHNPTTVLEHQRRFLRHTDLRAIQWINLRGQTVTFHTIER